MADRGFDDRGELAVLLFAIADIAGIDPVFGQRLRTSGMIGQQFMADIVKIADKRDVDAAFGQPVADMRHCSSRLVAIDRDANDFRTGPRKCGNLLHRGVNIGRVGVGHRLDNNRRTAADGHPAHRNRDGGTARQTLCEARPVHFKNTHRSFANRCFRKMSLFKPASQQHHVAAVQHVDGRRIDIFALLCCDAA